jgi:hypothetical protein
MRQMHQNLSATGNEHRDGQQTAGYEQARALVRDAIGRADKAGISGETLAFALIGEALPYIVRQHGPAWASEVLIRLAQRIRTGRF